MVSETSNQNTELWTRQFSPWKHQPVFRDLGHPCDPEMPRGQTYRYASSLWSTPSVELSTDDLCSHTGCWEMWDKWIFLWWWEKMWESLEGEGAMGQGMLKLSNASLVFLRKTLPFSLQHFSDARPSLWKHGMPAKCLTFPMSVVWSRAVLAAPVSGSQTFSVGRNQSWDSLKGSRGGSSLELGLT